MPGCRVAWSNVITFSTFSFPPACWLRTRSVWQTWYYQLKHSSHSQLWTLLLDSRKTHNYIWQIYLLKQQTQISVKCSRLVRSIHKQGVLAKIYLHSWWLSGDHKLDTNQTDRPNFAFTFVKIFDKQRLIFVLLVDVPWVCKSARNLTGMWCCGVYWSWRCAICGWAS